MPRPLRQPTDDERADLTSIEQITQAILSNIETNRRLSEERRRRVTALLADGWSMYGIAKETNMSPNTIKRIIEGGTR